MSGKNNDLLKGLCIGGLIGVALGVLLAPKSGQELRDDLMNNAHDLLTKAKEEYENIFKKSRQVFEESIENFNHLNLPAKEMAGEVENKIADTTRESLGIMQNDNSRFKKAIDAGMKAYREANNQ